MLPQTCPRGFTLVELMVTLAIVGLVASGISLSLNVLHGRDVEREVERLRQVLEATAERAQIRGQSVAIELLPDGYRLSQRDTADQWTLLDEPPLFTERRFPQALQWAPEHLAPGQARRLVFSQRAPHFTLVLQTSTQRFRLNGRITGAVELDLMSSP